MCSPIGIPNFTLLRDHNLFHLALGGRNNVVFCIWNTYQKFLVFEILLRNCILYCIWNTFCRSICILYLKYILRVFYPSLLGSPSSPVVVPGWIPGSTYLSLICIKRVKRDFVFGELGESCNLPIQILIFFMMRIFYYFTIYIISIK